MEHNTPIFILNDTQEKQLSVQLQQAHKMEAVGKLTSGIAHDLNSFLTALMGNLDLMTLVDAHRPVADVSTYISGVLGMLDTLFTPSTRLLFDEQGPTFAN